MTEKIYGNVYALRAFSSMFSSGRIPQSFLIYGEKGLGKKMLARRLAMALLCDSPQNGVPCGECRSCRSAAKNIHPDIIYPEQSGKLRTYTVEECRKVCADAWISPNDGKRKVYIFEDSDNIRTAAQNALLKIIEEPPSFVYFIFTAPSRDVFLPTIISRVTSIGASPCTEDECAAALALRGFESEDISAAMGAFGCNIGMCLEYLDSEQLRNITALTKKAADSIIGSNEYELLKIFSSADLKDRHILVQFLEMFDRVIRDSVALKYSDNGTVTGCYRKGSEKLSQKFSAKTAERIHTAVSRAADDVRANVNQGLVMSALCGEIMSS